MKAKLQLYVAKPVYSDQLNKQNKKYHDFGSRARLAVCTAPSNETVIWAPLLLALETRMDGCPSWKRESKEDPRGDSEWRPKPSRRIRPGGRTARTSPFSRARPAARPHSARAAQGACVTAALQHSSPGTPYSPVPSSGPRIPSWG